MNSMVSPKEKPCHKSLAKYLVADLYVCLLAILRRSEQPGE